MRQEKLRLELAADVEKTRLIEEAKRAKAEQDRQKLIKAAELEAVDMLKAKEVENDK